MAELLLLGTGAALTDGSREPTMLALRGATSTIVIDCGSNVIRALQQLRVPLDSIERLIITHAHQDHTSGFPLLVEMLWLSGRRAPLPIHGPAAALEIVRNVFAQWDTSDWVGLPELHWWPVPLEQNALIADGVDFELRAAPGVHGTTAVIGVRAMEHTTGAVITYSADGEPSEATQTLAHNTDVLVHEATGDYPGHSTAAGAAQLAQAAGAKQLVLVHLAPLVNNLEQQRQEAQAIFSGPVVIGIDGLVMSINAHSQ